MSGICGIYNYQRNTPVLSSELKRMSPMLMHRGDGKIGIYVYQNVGLGFQQSVEEGQTLIHQPLANVDESVWVVCDGTFENTEYLQRCPELKKYPLFSQSPAEILLHLYKEFGMDCLPKIEGVFSLAIWDNQKKRLILARDSLGARPLYYSDIDGRFFFASELKALLSVSQIPRYMDVEAINQFLHWGYLPGPQTIIERIKKVPPGHYVVCENNGCQLQRYWQIQFTNPGFKDEGFYKTELLSRLEESVRGQISNGEPIGILLSGGLDSSMLVAIAKKLSENPIMTFTLQSSDISTNLNTNYARQITRQFGTRHFELIMSARDFIDNFVEAAWYLDEPLADPSAIAYFQLSRFVRQNLSTVLSADGIDELLAGKDQYLLSYKMQHPFYFTSFSRPEPIEKSIYRLPRIKHWQKSISKNNQWESYLQRQQLDFEEQKLYSNQFWLKLKSQTQPWLNLNGLPANAENDLLQKILFLEIYYVVPNILLLKKDRLSRAVALTVNTPFLAPRFVKFSWQLPNEMKIHGMQTKYIWRQLAREILPDSIVWQQRVGWQIPITYWLRNQLREWPFKLLTSERIFARGLFNPERLKQLVTNHLEGQIEATQLLFALICLENWFRLFVDGESVNEAKISTLEVYHSSQNSG